MSKIFKGFSIFILILFLLIIIFISLVLPNSMDKHISQVISLIGMLTTLVSVIWTQYNKSLEEKNKIIQLELEQKHQITKEVYQELFTQKIKLYILLHEKLYEYQNNLLKIGKTEIDIDEKNKTIKEYIVTRTDIIVSFFQSIDKIFIKNLFIISNDLEKQYHKIKQNYNKTLNYIDDFDTLIGDEEETRSEQLKALKEFEEKHRKDINNFIKTIEKEVQEMKSNIGYKIIT